MIVFRKKCRDRVRFKIGFYLADFGIPRRGNVLVYVFLLLYYHDRTWEIERVFQSQTAYGSFEHLFIYRDRYDIISVKSVRGPGRNAKRRTETGTIESEIGTDLAWKRY